MAVNNAGAQLDTAGEIAIDFVWGNMAPQPNDARTTRLDLTLGDHINLESGWGGYPQYTANTAGSDVAGSTDYVQVPNVIGMLTADADDVMKDSGLTVTTAAGASNVGKTITAAARTAGSAVISLTCASHGFVAGNKVTVSDVSGGDGVNGVWTVLAVTSANVFTVTGTATTVQALTSLAGVVSGVAGTIKSVAYGSGTAANQTTASTVTVTPYAAAS